MDKSIYRDRNNPYGRLRSATTSGKVYWSELGNSKGRFESRPPKGVRLSRKQRLAWEAVALIQMWGEEGYFPVGHRHWGIFPSRERLEHERKVNRKIRSILSSGCTS